LHARCSQVGQLWSLIPCCSALVPSYPLRALQTHRQLKDIMRRTRDRPNALQTASNQSAAAPAGQGGLLRALRVMQSPCLGLCDWCWCMAGLAELAPLSPPPLQPPTAPIPALAAPAALLDTLVRAFETLETVQKRLEDYLENKRVDFPRCVLSLRVRRQGGGQEAIGCHLAAPAGDALGCGTCCVCSFTRRTCCTPLPPPSPSSGSTSCPMMSCWRSWPRPATARRCAVDCVDQPR